MTIKKIISSITIVFAATFTITIIIGLFGLIAALPVMWIWNYLMPAVFGLTVITYWQAFWMFFLSGILFKSYHYNNNS